MIFSERMVTQNNVNQNNVTQNNIIKNNATQNSSLKIANQNIHFLRLIQDTPIHRQTFF